MTVRTISDIHLDFRTAPEFFGVSSCLISVDNVASQESRDANALANCARILLSCVHEVRGSILSPSLICLINIHDNNDKNNNEHSYGVRTTPVYKGVHQHLCGRWQPYYRLHTPKYNTLVAKGSAALAAALAFPR